MQPGLELTPISKFHDAASFDCGDTARNRWLQNRAFTNQQSDDSRTYVLAEGPEVKGFFALAIGSVIRATLPGALRRNAPEHVGCVILAQLAVALPSQNKGYSRELLIYAMDRAGQVADAAGCRLLVVHPATPRLVTYYGNAGFTQVVAEPMLMVMPMARVRATLTAIRARPIAPAS